MRGDILACPFQRHTRPLIDVKRICRETFEERAQLSAVTSIFFFSLFTRNV